MRYAIWSEILRCSSCEKEVSYFDLAMERNPAKFKKSVKCPHCGQSQNVDEMSFVSEEFYDSILKRKISRKKRVPVWIYGTTNGQNWDRAACSEDEYFFESDDALDFKPKKILWGELHRSGYHYGITHLHHFYTQRNYYVMEKLWSLTESYPQKQQDALKLLLLSYNASHCTLMTRVVAKKNVQDFVLTGAQSGVLYISKAPVEKNIILGLQRKAKQFAEAYAVLEKCSGTVCIHNESSVSINEADESIDYVFTDPPFGDFIPYAEVNQINELWLNKVTNRTDEVIISNSQNKDVLKYQEMLTDVFKEINRTLKTNGNVSVVFHAAKARVWEAFGNVVNNSGFHIAISNILDKTQVSFKQAVSEGSVRGDPLFLLKKETTEDYIGLSDAEILENIIISNAGDSRFDKKRCYSLYVNMCLERGIVVTMDARQVYDYYNSQIGVKK